MYNEIKNADITFHLALNNHWDSRNQNKIHLAMPIYTDVKGL